MGKIYLRSKRSDRMCNEVQSSGVIKMSLIAIGIYDEFCHVNGISLNYEMFKDYYVEKIKELHAFSNHYLNAGAQLLKIYLQSQDNSIATSGRRIKKLCNTFHAKPIVIPENSSILLEGLFNYIYKNILLRRVFTEYILRNCNYCFLRPEFDIDNCTQYVLDFIFIFISSVLDGGYSERYKQKAVCIKGSVAKSIKNFQLDKQCCHRIN